MVEVSDSNDDYHISGYISYPENQRASRNSITTLINGRVIRNNDLVRIITDIYHLYMPKDKYPIIVLNIETDPILVDVNVHPTKMDVKFSKMDTLKELLSSMINSKLKELTMIPDISIKTRDDISFEEVEEDLNEISYQETTITFDVEEESENAVEKEEIKEEKVVKQMEMEEILPEEYKIKEMIPRGIVYKTYIIAENSDGMYIIDQHAAAERVNYEKCMKKVLSSQIERVDMLIPVRVELPKNEFLIVREHLGLLDELGLLTEEFDENTFIVRTHPTWIRGDLEKGDIEKLGIFTNTWDGYDETNLKKGIIYELPSGIIFNNTLLNNVLPKIPVKIDLIGNIFCKLNTDIKSYGINNALMEISIQIEADVKILLPFVSSNTKINVDVPIIMKIMEGNVPSYYFDGYLNTMTNG